MASRSRDTAFIELFDDKPLTQANFMQYVNGDKYDGTIMHRLAEDFVIQGGGFYPVFVDEPPPVYVSLDPTATVDLDGNPATANPTVVNEYSVGTTRSNVKGTIAMARVGGSPNSATNQWFVNLNNNAFLDGIDGGFTVFARVAGDGMAMFDAFNAGPPIYITNLNPDTNNDGQRDGGPFFNYTANPPGSDGVPFLDGQQSDLLVVLQDAERIDYLGSGLTTTVPAGGLTFSARDAFVDTGTLFTGTGALTVGVGRELGIREGTNLTRPLINLGTLAPGLQLGSITVDSFRQDPGASLEIQINGTTADTTYDRIVATGGALLGGDLNVTTLGYNPALPATAAPSETLYTFTILTAGLISGSFNNINLFELDAGMVWGISKTNTAFILTVNTGDFNRDGIVDTADYVLWRKTRNTSVATAYAGADGNGDLQINDADYLIWKKNLGNTAGGSGGGAGGLSNSSVPEPSAVALVLGGLACIARLRRRCSSIRRKTV
ncbi:MAG: peptidylprolyl isomerase [Planctomycetes bacterium]|nr:peptidylprolyl isomerase [Planctomycetota bacterium]